VCNDQCRGSTHVVVVIKTAVETNPLFTKELVAVADGEVKRVFIHSLLNESEIEPLYMAL